MPFNGSGTFNPAITFVPNTPATAEDQNTQDTDFAAGLSDCMTRDGQAPATANISMGGFQINDLSPGTSPTDAVILSQISNFIPSGIVQMFAGTSPPTGYLLCDGTAYSRTTYLNLFSIIGTTFGAGDGSTTFNVPDLRSRVPVGAGTGVGLSNRSLGGSGGEETHVLITAEIPPHNHTDSGHTHPILDPGHTHTVPQGGTTGGGYSTLGNGLGSVPLSTTVSTTGISVNSGAANIQNTGGGGSHNNMQPWLGVNYIIKT